VALPDPNVPIQGRRFVIVTVVVGIVFTIVMAAITYGFALGWAELHHQPKPGPTQHPKE
jgi:hypothetical protein